ncbi:O-antigen ligase family protein [Nocardioides pinisoli]|uniref:O-antigen ligase family protein n=1 Tax=Nocardioides pinisoli TaxID=2950279 RepID=A0ABT1KSE5_9ACTN|nr:hypothetical protein [Nocardioides pinisoli]MCP3420660.1 hypothetical protein [Nocardioides pinisoli]
MRATGGRPWLLTRTREPAAWGSTRSVLWVLFLAQVYYLLANPLLTIGPFDISFGRAWKLAAVWLVLQLPWMRLPRVAWPLAAYLGWAALSWTWSMSPESTVRALVIYGAVALIGVLSAANIDLRTFAAGVAAGGVTVLAASIHAAATGVPGAGTPPGNDGWLVGVVANANILGYTLVPALAAMLAMTPRSRWGWAPWTAVTVFLATGVVLAYSGTAMVAAVSVAATAAAVAALRWLAGTRHWRIEVIVGVMLALAFPAYQLVGAVLLGREVATLDGRVEVWSAAIESSRPALWNGEGFGAVWFHAWHIAPPNPVLERIHDLTGIPFSHGHNSFVDPLPEVGLIGVGLLLSCHLLVGWRAVRLLMAADRRTDARVRGGFLLVMLVALVTLGIAEPVAGTPLGWFLLSALLSTSGSTPLDRLGPSTTEVAEVELGPLASDRKLQPAASPALQPGRRRAPQRREWISGRRRSTSDSSA